MLKEAVVPKYQMSIFDADFAGGDTEREYKPDIILESSKEPAVKITDPFGEHIGGARKELWSGRGLGHEGIALMNSMERDKYIRKDNIWKKPDYMDMIRRGRAVEIVYAIKKIRDSIMPTLPYNSMDNTDELRIKRQEAYITFCSEIRDMAMGLTTEEDLYGICQNFLIDRGYVVKKGNSISPTAKSGVLLTSKLFKSLNITRTTVIRYRCDIKRTGFGTEKDKKCRSTSGRKKAFIPKQVQNIERSGLADVRNGCDMTGKDFIGSFGHELFHALDDIIGKKLGLGGMMTKYCKKSTNVPYSVRKLMKTMFYREEAIPGNKETKEVPTDYMKNSMKMDGRYSRELFGY